MILKNCNFCVIYEPESDIPLKARVKCADERIELYFEDDHRLGDHIDKVRIDFFDSQIGQIKTYCELDIRKNTDPQISEAWISDCRILETIETLQRQQDLRVDLNEETLLSSKKHGYFSCTIHNISVGGLYMTTDTSLEVDEQFEFQYCFVKKIFKLRASVLRKTVIGENNFGYGCLFINLPSGAEKEIRQFVYRRQRSNSNI